MKLIAIVLCVLILLAVTGYWGLHVTPRPFDPYPATTPALTTVPLPDNLPAPVQRFYQITVGDRVPVVETAVLSMHGSMKLFGLRLPMRMRVVHAAGQGYWRIMQPTFFGYPIATLQDTYWNGNAHLDMPGIKDNDPKMNAGSNVVLWAESLSSLPSILLTDPRVRWEPIDETHARLLVPSPEGQAAIKVTFDAQTGLVSATEAPKWRQPTDAEQTLWRTKAGPETKRFHGLLLGTTGQVAWDGEPPWFEQVLDEVLYNVDIQPFITAHPLK